MTERFTMCILRGNYEAAEKLCKTIDDSTIRELLIANAYDTENISIYSFIRYMIEKTRRTNWMELAIEVMTNPLCFLEGAYSIALFHAKELLEIDRNVANLERMIFFHNIPERLVDEKEAIFISEEILRAEPDDEVALSVQNRYNI